MLVRPGTTGGAGGQGQPAGRAAGGGPGAPDRAGGGVPGGAGGQGRPGRGRPGASGEAGGRVVGLAAARGRPAGRAARGGPAGGGPAGRVGWPEPMTPEEADEAFDCLSRHARAITRPTVPAEALALVDQAALAQLQRDAIVHYVSKGPAVVNLAYRVLKAGTATFVAARFAAGVAAAEPPPERALFAERMIALDRALAGAGPGDRAAGLLDALSARLAGGRALLEAGASDPDGPDGPGGIGDLLEAAGIAYVLAQLLENPPRPALAVG